MVGLLILCGGESQRASFLSYVGGWWTKIQGAQTRHNKIRPSVCAYGAPLVVYGMMINLSWPLVSPLCLIENGSSLSKWLH